VGDDDDAAMHAFLTFHVSKSMTHLLLRAVGDVRRLVHKDQLLSFLSLYLLLGFFLSLSLSLSICLFGFFAASGARQSQSQRDSAPLR
jgi:hypothetical protein